MYLYNIYCYHVLLLFIFFVETFPFQTFTIFCLSPLFSHFLKYVFKKARAQEQARRREARRAMEQALATEEAHLSTHERLTRAVSRATLELAAAKKGSEFVLQLSRPLGVAVEPDLVISSVAPQGQAAQVLELNVGCRIVGILTVKVDENGGGGGGGSGGGGGVIFGKVNSVRSLDDLKAVLLACRQRGELECVVKFVDPRRFAAAKAEVIASSS